MGLSGNNISINAGENVELFHKLQDAIKYFFPFSPLQSFHWSTLVRMCFIRGNLHPHWKREISLWIYRSKSKYFNNGIQYDLCGNDSLSRLSINLWFCGLFFHVLVLIMSMNFRIIIFNVRQWNISIMNGSILKSSHINFVKNTLAMINQWCQIERLDYIWNYSTYFFPCFFFYSIFTM